MLFMSRNGHDKNMTKMYGNGLMFWLRNGELLVHSPEHTSPLTELELKENAMVLTR
jgi:hypothetical protein